MKCHLKNYKITHLIGCMKSIRIFNAQKKKENNLYYQIFYRQFAKTFPLMN